MLWGTPPRGFTRAANGTSISTSSTPLTEEPRRKKYMVPKDRLKRRRYQTAQEMLTRIGARLREGWNPWISETGTRGNYGIRIALADGYMPLVEMDSDESRRFRSLQPDANARQDFLLALAANHLTLADAVAVKDRIRQQTQTQTKVRVLPLRHQDFTPDLSRAFAGNLASALHSLNVSSGISGHKREHEVGNHSRYDDIDDRQSGTKLTM